MYTKKDKIFFQAAQSGNIFLRKRFFKRRKIRTAKNSSDGKNKNDGEKIKSEKIIDNGKELRVRIMNEEKQQNKRELTELPVRYAIYKLADLRIKIGMRFAYSAKMLEPYRVSGDEYDFEVTPREEDIAAIDPEVPASDYYRENLAVLKLVSDRLLDDYDGFLFHCTSLEYAGNGYAFTARSGTGKSTHARLLTQLLGNKISYINDDKPFVRYFRDRDEFVIYGNPWNGKHNLGNNVSAPLKGVCILTRGKENSIRREKDLFRVLSCLGNQILYPDTREQGEKFMDLINLLFEKVPFYLLSCNISEEAAKTSFEGMIKGGAQ